MEMKNICGKIPVELHEKVKLEVEELGISIPKYAKTNTLKQRVERHTCELCGKDCRNLEIHQVKKLKDLKGNAEWVLLMRKRRRKTLVVCPECHKLIHS